MYEKSGIRKVSSTKKYSDILEYTVVTLALRAKFKDLSNGKLFSL